ncbi:TetR/AcrR family transcriptional regulator [Roseobacteraceae bacterium S113]
MTDLANPIVMAAKTMFARYGYAKTTMGDIAAEAGVARQTVYNAYANKEEVLRAVVQWAGYDTRDRVVEAWAQADDLDAKLEAFIRIGPMSWYEATRAAPDWAELVDGMHRAATEVLTELEIEWKSNFADVLAAEQGTPKIPVDDIAEFFYSCCMNAKYGVAGPEQLEQRLMAIKAATLALMDN